jgi:hypothetical protein
MANDGLDVLGDATKYFLNIQLAARSMGSTVVTHFSVTWITADAK